LGAETPASIGEPVTTCDNSRVPDVARVGPYRFFFYSNERGEPPHIHVRQDRKVAKFWLEPVSLAASKRFAAHELNQLERIVTEHETELKEAWNEHLGS
jgi:hypothetical protein